MNIAKLLKKAKRGNKEALLQLVMLQQHDYYRLAYTYVENEHDAMDALENMIVIVYEKINQLKDVEAFYSWSKTILVNECRTMLKKKSRVLFIEEEELLEQPFNPIEAIEQQLEIDYYLTILTPVHREALQLKYLLDYDYETIAQLTNVSVNTAKTRVFYALKKLRTHFGEENTSNEQL